MIVLDLCRDPADPRRTCRGVECKCRGAYVKRFEVKDVHREAGPGEAYYSCPGCGASLLGPVARRPVPVRCPWCDAQWAAAPRPGPLRRLFKR